MGSESDPPILNLTKPLGRLERRDLINRLRKQQSAIRRKLIHGTDKQNSAIAKTIDKIHLSIGITISWGEALHLIAGGKNCFNGKWLRGTAKGEVFSTAPSHKAQAIRMLSRVADLAGLVTKNQLISLYIICINCFPILFPSHLLLICDTVFLYSIAKWRLCEQRVKRARYD